MPLFLKDAKWRPGQRPACPAAGEQLPAPGLRLGQGAGLDVEVAEGGLEGGPGLGGQAR